MSKIAIARINEISREEWLQLRKSGIGGSDAACACGLSRFKSRLMLYLEKTSAVVEDIDNESMYFGRIFEPILRQEFAKRTGFTVQEVPFMFSCKEYPWMLANIDGLVTEPDGSKALLEIKTASSFKAKEWEDGLPQEYYLQVQHYLAVCDLPKAYVAVLIGGNQFRWEPVARDEEIVRILTALEAEFWSFVERGIQPPIDEQSGDALAVLYPKSDAKTSVILPAESDNIIAAYLEVKRAMTNLKEAQDGYENQLKSMMKTSSSAVTPNGYTIKWQSTTTNRLDTTRLKKEHPDIAKEYVTQTTSRRFSITEPKEETETTAKAS